MTAEDFDKTHQQIVDFALLLEKATPGSTRPDIAVMGALSYVAAIARSDPGLTARTAVVMERLAAELADMPSSAPPATH
ncbi:hypothetical protein G8A07_15635 [Roseateles sp. DAIF2]|uniref:hypothetical protein n=1 Tax=Roseateles sp. DAIF2 TaxID=2714952 RepID=UPI0018A31003|nr:hypothetical protein [Roseateles sp. DAIF2]QPF74207.1 hypothetical protein G8A07_15635 [Roseateles sp. DAIF2]